MASNPRGPWPGCRSGVYGPQRHPHIMRTVGGQTAVSALHNHRLGMRRQASGNGTFDRSNRPRMLDRLSSGYSPSSPRSMSRDSLQPRFRDGVPRTAFRSVCNSSLGRGGKM